MFSFLQKINPHKKSTEHKSFSLSLKTKETTPDFVYSDNTKSDPSLTKQRSNSEKHANKSHFSRKANLSLTAGSGYFTTGRFHNKKSTSLGTAISLIQI